MSDTETKRWKAAAGLTKKAAKLVNAALGAIRTEAKTHGELWGVIGVDEHRGDYYVPIGPMREDCSKALTGLAETFNWTAKMDNYEAIIAEADYALLALKAARPVVDKRRTPEQEAERMRKVEAAELERIEKDRVEHESIEAIAAQLRPQYPHAKTPSDICRYRIAGANLKEQLERTFPAVRMYVKSTYSAIDITWKMGPCEADVEKVARLYRLKTTGTREEVLESRALDSILGSVEYVHLHREIPEETRTLVARYMAEALAMDFHGMGDKPGISEPGCDWWTETHRLFVSHSFPAGAEITGVKADDTGIWQILSKVKVPDPFVTVTSVNVSFNASKNGVEIRFPEQPSPEVLERIKRGPHRFRWLARGKLWYTRCNRESWAWAHWIVGLPEAPYPLGAPVPMSPDSGYVQAQENANQDAIAAAIGV